MLTTPCQEHPTRAAVLEMLWPSCLAITIWPFVKVTPILMVAHFFLLLTHRLQGQSVPLLPNISNPLSSAIVMRYSMLFTLPVSGPNVMAERCIGPVWLLNLVIYNQVKEICTIFTHNSTLYSPSWLHHSSLDRFMWIRKFQVWFRHPSPTASRFSWDWITELSCNPAV